MSDPILKIKNLSVEFPLFGGILQREVAKVNAQVKKVEQDGSWEEKAMSASDSSWKDEAWTVCFIALIFACFIPQLQPFISDGFKFLREDCPDWLSYGILASIAASFGLKSIAKLKNK